MKTSLITPIIALGFGVGAASAQDLSFSGEVGLTFGQLGVLEVDEVAEDENRVGFGEIEGRIALDINDTFIIAFDARTREDDLASSDDFDSDEDPASSISYGLHGYYKLPESLIGGFVSYSDTRPQDGDKDDAYDALIYGLAGQTFLSPDMLIFGQISLADKVREGDDEDEGIVGGVGFGGGLQFFMGDDSAFTLDFEHLTLDNYIDSNDPGFGYGAQLTYERMFDTSFAPLILSGGVGFNHINSTDEGDHLNEVTASLGVTVLFGGATDLRARAATGANLNTPDLPSRMAGWTEWAD